MNTNPDYAVEIKALRKLYRSQGGHGETLALKDVDLTIPKGSIFGLLGPNGAGKSTLINILAGLTIKTSGLAKIWDIDIDDNPRQARAAIGVVPQEVNIDHFFAPREVLEVQAGLYGVPKAERHTDDLLNAVRLMDKADAYSRMLSGGMKRRLMVAKAMVHNPPVLVLDEPTAGVDIELRHELWDHVRELNKRGTTILLTTHYLEEAEEMCDEIAIINHGDIVACDKTKNLLSRLDSKELHLTLTKPVHSIPESFKDLHARKIGDNVIAFNYTPSQTHIGDILDRVKAEGFEIKDISSVESDLEDIFLQVTRAPNAAD